VVSGSGGWPGTEHLRSSGKPVCFQTRPLPLQEGRGAMPTDALIEEVVGSLVTRIIGGLRSVIRDEIRSALQERERDAYLNNRQAAAYAGRSLAAWGVFCRRHPDLLKMAIVDALGPEAWPFVTGATDTLVAPPLLGEGRR
jgi:hypothetical protein